MQYLQPIHVCLFTKTIPSARLNDAPVGHTSTQGGFSQCWHIIGIECCLPENSSIKLSFLIHCVSVAGLPKSSIPCSSLHAVTHASQSSVH